MLRWKLACLKICAAFVCLIKKYLYKQRTKKKSINETENNKKKNIKKYAANGKNVQREIKSILMEWTNFLHLIQLCMKSCFVILFRYKTVWVFWGFWLWWQKEKKISNWYIRVKLNKKTKISQLLSMPIVFAIIFCYLVGFIMI